jgi:hypothetical protein
MTDEVIIATNSGFEIIQRTCDHIPTSERQSHETWVIAFYLKLISTNERRPFEIYAGEGPPPPFKFSWVSPGVVAWDRTWITAVRSSSVFGLMPVREKKSLVFDFHQPEHSQILFREPSLPLGDGHYYEVLGRAFFYDFATGIMSSWQPGRS